MGSLSSQTFINLFSIYLTSISYVQVTVLETEDKSVNKIHKDLYPLGADILAGVESNKIIN